MPRGSPTEALNGDFILVDGDQGIGASAPRDTVRTAFRDKLAMQAEAQERYASIRDNRRGARWGRHGAAYERRADGRSAALKVSGAEGVGLFRTELQFLVRNKMPRGPSWPRFTRA
jgi:phosphotransferase system enzyme I (PtsP)